MDEGDQLENLIQKLLQERGFLPGVMGDYLIIAAQSHLGEDEEALTSVSYLSPSSAPHYRLIGLLESARNLLNEEMRRNEES